MGNRQASTPLISSKGYNFILFGISIMLKYDNFDIRVTASAGLTTMTSEDNIISLLTRRDKALYEAKQQGRNRVVVANADS